MAHHLGHGAGAQGPDRAREGGAEIEAPVTINVTLNEGEAQSVQITPETSSVAWTIPLEDALLGMENTVDIQIEQQSAAS